MESMSFIDEAVEVLYDKPPMFEKKPECPNAFVWRGETYRISHMLAEWFDFERRGRMAKNMRPAHTSRASIHGSWGVGRFYFRVRVANGRTFELYYDRAPQDADHRKGNWFLFLERI